MSEVLSEGDWQDVLAVLPAGVVMLNGHGQVFQTNPAAEQLLGEALIGRLWVEVIQEAFAPREDDGHEVSLRDGRRVSITTSSLTGGRGQLILLQDMTETRELQSALSRHERLSSMGKMVASLAHQLRTPLSTALLYSGHLQKAGLPDDKRQRFAHKLTDRLRHMDRQIKDMLIFAKGETHMAQRVTLGQLLGSIRQAVEPVLDRAGACCDWSLPAQDEASQVFMVVSEDSLVGAILNLVNNALEVSVPPPPLRLHVEYVETLPQQVGKHVLMCLMDEGPGIDEALLNKVNEPFFTTKSQGTGLGLAIVRAVIEAHKGRFWLQSVPEQGTRAWIALPAET